MIFFFKKVNEAKSSALQNCENEDFLRKSFDKRK